MRIRIALLSLLASLLSSGFLITSTPVANAGCRDFPESVTPACEAQNMAEEKSRQAADEVLRAKQLADADAAAKANAELEYVRNGSRPCSVYPASITAACATENLEYETKRQVAATAQLAQDVIAAEEKALKQAQDDYIRNGSRPCSVFPASTTAECATANLQFEEVKKVEIAALTAAREVSSKSLITTKDENGSLLVASNIPKGVDLLTTKVKLLNSKGKVVDTGEIRYDGAGKPYFVFDKQVGKGNYKIELSIPKKKSATISVKL